MEMGNKSGYLAKGVRSLSDQYVNLQLTLLKTYRKTCTFVLMWAWCLQVQSPPHSTTLENILPVFYWSRAGLKIS